MEIKDNECMSAVFTGVQGASDWIQKKSSDAMKWLKAKILNIKGLIKNLAKSAKDKVVQGYEFLKNWFNDSPVGATAGILAGGLVIGVGVSALAGGALISGVGGAGAALIGAVSGAGIATVAKLAGLASLGAAGFFGYKLINSGAELVATTSAIYNFDWNISNEAIRQQQKAAMDSLIAPLGEVVGYGIGGLVCGALPSAGTVEVNYKLLAKVWYLMKEEVREEIVDSITNLIMQSKRAAYTVAFLESFKNVRDFIKNNVKTGIKVIDDTTEAWGASKGSWILREKVEEKIESIDNQKVRNFVENVYEASLDICSTSVLAAG